MRSLWTTCLLLSVVATGCSDSKRRPAHGVTVSPLSSATTEAGTQASFSVVLDTRPDSNVVIPFESADLSEGTISPDSLTFTPVNWNAPQSIMVTGVDDDLADGNQTYSIQPLATVSTHLVYHNLELEEIPVTNVDDETAGISISRVSGPTTENGGQASFTVVLNSEPTADVTIALASSDSNEGTVSPASLVFTSSNWSAPQTVTVTGVDDFVDDGHQAFAADFSGITSTDTDYAALNLDDVPVTNLDDETAGITIGPVSGPTFEAGGSARISANATFSVVLDSQPTADVGVFLNSQDLSEGTLGDTVLWFTSTDWNAPQNVRAFGVNDDIMDGNQIYAVSFVGTSSTDSNYQGLTPDDVDITNIDDESAGIMISDVSGPTTEAGGQATFSIELTSEPTSDVTVAFSSNDASEGAATPASLTFTSLNWDAPQIVTVTGQDDFDADGNQPYAIAFSGATSLDSDYSGMLPPNVVVTNVDDETAGISVSAASGPTTEAGGQASFTVVLDSMPSAGVTVNFDSDDTSEGTVSPTSLTFNSLNWNAPQTVTVTGADDPDADGNQPYNVAFTATTSSDSNYSAITPASLAITNVDDESAGITVSSVSGPTTESGGQATFTVALDSMPSADVIVNFASNDTSEASAGVSSLTFNSVNWNAPQTVIVTGADDLEADGNQAYGIAFTATTSTDLDYSGIIPLDVPITNIDDETAGITVSAVSGPTTESGGQASFSIVLDSMPTADVILNFASDDTSEATAGVSSLTFNSVNWNAPQTVMLTGVDDVEADGNQFYNVVFSATSSTDSAYAGLTPANIAASNVDDETAGITVSSSLISTTEGGGQSTFSVALNSQPTDNVTVNFDSSNLAEGTVSATSLTFTSVNWSSPQVVTITGQDDLAADGNQAYSIAFTASASADADYNGITPASVAVTNIDDDSAGILVEAVSSTTTEAGDPAVFSVVLTSLPTADVTVNFSTNDSTEGVLPFTNLTFTPLDWSTPQFTTVVGVDDSLADGNQPYAITFSGATSTDPQYAGLAPADISIANVDDETADIQVSAISGPTTEAGGTATYSIVLTSEPTADVTVNFNSNDTSEGTVSATSLIFTTLNWSTPQVVTVTGQDDLTADGNVAFAIVFSATNSADSDYLGMVPPNVLVTNVDDD